MRETTPRPAARAGGRLSVRVATGDDRAFVRRLAHSVFSIYGSYDRYLVEWFDTQGVLTLVGELDEQPVGLAMLMAYPNRMKGDEALADLLAIAVVPEFQTQGVGTALLTKAIAEAPLLDSEHPIREIHLSVADGNARGQRLFSQHGFRFSRDEGIYPAGQRALHMSRSI